MTAPRTPLCPADRLRRAVRTVAVLLLLAVPRPALATWPSTNALLSTDAFSRSSVRAAPDGLGGAFVVWVETYRNSSDIYVQHVEANGLPSWDADGVPVCTALGAQTVPAVVADGAGGAIVAWQDRRDANSDIYAQRFSVKGFPLWTTNGVVVCDQAADQNNPDLVSDGSGGAVVTWEDKRNVQEDIYVQHVSGAGVATWTANGVALCTASSTQLGPRIVADGSGGAIVAWRDFRSTSLDVYARRVKYDGTAQWATDGVALCIKNGDQDQVVLASDGVGGAIAAWRDARNGTADIFAARVTSAGATPWLKNGIAVCAADSVQEAPAIVSDGAAGAVVAWQDKRGASRDVYAQRISSAGAAAWTANGVAIGSFAGDQTDPALAPDGTGGVMVAWRDTRTGAADVYARRVTLAGTATGDPGGIAVCSAPGDQDAPTIVPDGIGGAIVAWADPRGGESEPYARRLDGAGAPLSPPDGVLLAKQTPAQIVRGAVTDSSGGAIVVWEEDFRSLQTVYAQHVDASGVVSWTPTGAAVSKPTNSHQVSPDITTDGSGGAIVTWSDDRNGFFDIYAQHLDATGTRAWDDFGVQVSGAGTGGDQDDPVIASDGAGGAIMAWVDYRNGAPDIYAERLDALGAIMWTTANGEPVCVETGNQTQVRIVTVPGGGAASWLVWKDGRSGNGDIYANRLNAIGKTTWGSGADVCTVPGRQDLPQITLSGTGAGNLYVVWEDARGADVDIYGQRIDSGITPTVFWAVDGYPIIHLAGDQTEPRIEAAGDGVFVTWKDARSAPAVDAYVQLVSSAPSRKWGTNGEALSQSGAVVETPALCLNGGDLFAAWADQGRIRAQKLDAVLGTKAWGADGFAVTAIPTQENDVTLLASGASGAIGAWDDVRIQDTDAYAQLLTTGGPLAAPVVAPPAEILLAPVAPNPVTDGATFRFSTPRAGRVALAVFDAQGRLVRRLLDEWAGPGARTVRWDGRSGDGVPLESGVYFARLRSGTTSVSRAFVKVR